MFTEEDFEGLTKVFALARVQVVNSNPDNRAGIESVMNFEVILKNKLTEANEAAKPEELPTEEA